MLHAQVASSTICMRVLGLRQSGRRQGLKDIGLPDDKIWVPDARLDNLGEKTGFLLKLLFLRGDSTEPLHATCLCGPCEYLCRKLQYRARAMPEPCPSKAKDTHETQCVRIFDSEIGKDVPFLEVIIAVLGSHHSKNAF